MVRTGIKLLLIFVLVYTGVTLWYGRLEEKMQKDLVVRSQPVAPPPVEQKTEILRKPNDYTIIVKRNIFQAALEKKEEKVEEVVEQKVLAPTKLKLSLMGTISGNERDARAIISDDAKRQQDIYQVGDSLQGALIKSIDRAKVVLTVNGKDEVLTLKDREGGGPAYQPSPSDYYKEPTPQPQVQGQPATSTKKQPTVRPRPIRRPPSQTR